MNAMMVYGNYVKTMMSDFMHDEQGDTNFISIVIILGIVIVVAGVFIGFGGQIIDWVNTNLLGKSGLSGVDSAQNPLKDLKNG